MVYFILVGDIIQSTFLLLVIYKAVCHILHQNSSDPCGHVIGTSVLWHQDAFVLVLVVLSSLDWSRFGASFRCLTRLVFRLSEPTCFSHVTSTFNHLQPIIFHYSKYCCFFDTWFLALDTFAFLLRFLIQIFLTNLFCRSIPRGTSTHS